MRSAQSPRRVWFVKKILVDGEACGKCRDIQQRLVRDGLMERVDGIIEAVEGDDHSPGALLAARHGVQRAPFFVVVQPDGRERVMASYLAFKRWCTAEASSSDLADTVDQHPDLAFI